MPRVLVPEGICVCFNANQTRLWFLTFNSSTLRRPSSLMKVVFWLWWYNYSPSRRPLLRLGSMIRIKDNYSYETAAPISIKLKLFIRRSALTWRGGGGRCNCETLHRSQSKSPQTDDIFVLSNGRCQFLWVTVKAWLLWLWFLFLCSTLYWCLAAAVVTRVRSATSRVNHWGTGEKRKSVYSPPPDHSSL